MFDLSDRVAFVTGAGQNVGAEIARTLARLGATMAVNDLFADRAEAVASQIVSTGGRAIPAPADITDGAAIDAAFDAVEADLGGVDILVNNAGVLVGPQWDLTPFHRTESDDWRPWVEISFFGVLRCCHRALPAMVQRGHGRVVTIVSEGGRIGQENLAVYSGAKAGAAGFMRAIAREVAPHGVTANCVALGTITPPGVTDDVIAKIARNYPTGRLGAPEDVAGAVAYLASDEASWVTGQTLGVSGGFAIL